MEGEVRGNSVKTNKSGMMKDFKHKTDAFYSNINVRIMWKVLKIWIFEQTTPECFGCFGFVPKKGILTVNGLVFITRYKFALGSYSEDWGRKEECKDKNFISKFFTISLINLMSWVTSYLFKD